MPGASEPTWLSSLTGVAPREKQTRYVAGSLELLRRSHWMMTRRPALFDERGLMLRKQQNQQQCRQQRVDYTYSRKTLCEIVMEMKIAVQMNVLPQTVFF